VLSPEEARQLAAGTFHSLCHRWLRQHIKVLDPGAQGYSKDFVIYDEQVGAGAGGLGLGLQVGVAPACCCGGGAVCE
jgi:hypothetical protein